ncbi:MBL fold metallo-hydrolase [Candidatus Bipolaricaulota bacterium]|nr:MBL fold metallo-hydrolase [Candidatus Bipolaricaulota bacterium]
MKVRPIWFDSLGAKSMCVLVETPDIRLLIDPGAAIMQPRYPAPTELKLYYLELATAALVAAAARATHIAITHYHYDHHRPDIPELFREKTLWIKDPNRWINRSQWERSRYFLSVLASEQGIALEEVPPEKGEYPDPLEELPRARKEGASEELRRKWRKRFLGLVRIWEQGPWISSGSFGAQVVYADGKVFEIGETTVRFTEPLFHGVEYASPGWVLAIVVEHGGKKFLYSSDLQGPIIEDYAEWIAAEAPDVLVLDGPATYLRGPLQAAATLERAIRNCAEAVRGARARVTILDHHLTREPRFRDACREAFSAGAITGAEALGLPPLTDRLSTWKAKGKLEEMVERARAGELDSHLPSRGLSVDLLGL